MTTTATRTNNRSRSSRRSTSSKAAKPQLTEACLAKKKERQDAAKALALLGFDAIEQAATSGTCGDLSDTLSRIHQKTLPLRLKLEHGTPIEDEELHIPAGSLTFRPIDEVVGNLSEGELKNLSKVPEIVGAYDLLERWLEASPEVKKWHKGAPISVAVDTLLTAGAYLSNALGFLEEPGKESRDPVIYSNPLSMLVGLSITVTLKKAQRAAEVQCPEQIQYQRIVALLKEAETIKEEIRTESQKRPYPNTPELIRRAAAKVN